MTTEQFTGMELTPEQERRYILDVVGPDRYIIVVPKSLRDAIMEKHQFKPKDVPGLIVPRFGEIGRFNGVVIYENGQAFGRVHRPEPMQRLNKPILGPKPLPYPPRLRGRYAR